MTVRELLRRLDEELSEEEKDLPICYNDTEWGAFECEVKRFDIYRSLKGDEAIVLES